MISCERCDDLLIDYHYGELELAQRRAVAAHLGECGDCARAYCRLQADLDGITEGLQATPRPSVQAQLRTAIEREFRPPAWQRVLALLARPVPAYQAAIALFALLLVFALLSGELSVVHTSAQPLLTDYDASHLLRIDPNAI